MNQKRLTKRETARLLKRFDRYRKKDLAAYFSMCRDCPVPEILDAAHRAGRDQGWWMRQNGIEYEEIFT